LKVEVLISTSTPQTIQIVLEYGELAIRQDLSEREADRIEEILALANEKPALSFWIDEVDHCLGHRLGLLGEEDLIYYKNQQVVLREYLEALIDTYSNQKISVDHLGIMPKSQLPDQPSSGVEQTAHQIATD
jgi:hypothetical protein